MSSSTLATAGKQEYFLVRPNQAQQEAEHSRAQGTVTKIAKENCKIPRWEQRKTRGTLGEKGKERPTTDSPRSTHTDNEGRRRRRNVY